MQAKSKKFVVFFEYALTLHMVPKHQPDDQQTGVEGAEESEPVFEHRQSTEEAQNRAHYNWRSTTRHNSRHCVHNWEHHHPAPGTHPPTI